MVFGGQGLCNLNLADTESCFLYFMGSFRTSSLKLLLQLTYSWELQGFERIGKLHTSKIVINKFIL